MTSTRNSILYSLLGAAWVIALTLGLRWLWTYEATASVPARAPITWPRDTGLSRVAGLPTLVLLLHPKCPCSRATVGELAKLMTACQGKLVAKVLMLRPPTMPAGWERTDLWDSAAAIPGVLVVADVDGAEARRFGAETSGQSLLFAADGRLLFAGGMTESRGHSGDNDGRSTLMSLVLTGSITAQPAHTPVYGCPLFDESSNCLKPGASTCRRQ